MQKNRWSRKFDWIKSGTTYIQQVQSVLYDENQFIAVGDIYFKLNKYLTGVTFTYINSLEDIYKRDLMTGDGYSLVNMYNEYDVIDRVLKNFVEVDAAADINIDLTKQVNIVGNSIAGVTLKPGHLVLLKNQNPEFNNDVYIVNEEYYLENAGYLSSKEKSDKFSCVVKLGLNFDKHFYLTNNGFDFPTTLEPKYFIEGNSFLLKNLIKYNMYNTSTGTTSKIIFTDYDVARKQLVDNFELYYDIMTDIDSTTLPSNYVTINYHKDVYNIRSGIFNTFSGVTTSGITNSGISNNTYIMISIPFFDCLDEDYINLKIFDISGNTILDMNTFVKTVQYGYIILEDTIPNYILTDLNNNIFTVRNLQVSTDWNDVILNLSNTPYSYYYSLSAKTYTSTYNFKIKPKEYNYNKYFDYDGLTFNFSDESNFNYFYTLNHYINYKLYDRLNSINIGFTTGFTFFNEYLLNVSTYEYFDDKIRITTTLTGMTNFFKPYTYVYASGIKSDYSSNEPTQRVIVYSVDDYEVVIEAPSKWIKNPASILLSIQNIDGLKNISDLLYEVYMNDSYDWYIKKSDNERKYIAKAYAKLLSQSDYFRKNITGLLYENDNNEFVLNLYETDSNKDPNLYFYTKDLVFIGSDRKSRLPVPFTVSSGVTEIYSNNYTGSTVELLDWRVLGSGVDNNLDGTDVSYISGSTYYEIISQAQLLGDVIDGGDDVVLPGPNQPNSLMYVIIDGGLDSSLYDNDDIM
jgi:hypothetical protein